MFISRLKNILAKELRKPTAIAKHLGLPRPFIQGLIDNSFINLNMQYLGILLDWLGKDFSEVFYYVPYNFEFEPVFYDEESNTYHLRVKIYSNKLEYQQIFNVIASEVVEEMNGKGCLEERADKYWALEIDERKEWEKIFKKYDSVFIDVIDAKVIALLMNCMGEKGVLPTFVIDELKEFLYAYGIDDILY